MKHPSSPLVWLCAAGAVTLGALAAIDPGSVYANYRAALDGTTPPIAAVFTAAQDGVYPWSKAQSDDPVPTYRPLTGTITHEEMQSSVGTAEPFREAAEPAAEDTAAGSVSSDAADAAAAAPETAKPLISGGNGEAVKAEAPESAFITVDESWFSDALFIGDSHTEGFADYAGVKGATFFFKRGLDIWSVMKKSFVDGKHTIPEALSGKQFGKIYILLGINEIGCGTTESFASQYAKVVEQLRELQPNALIYIQSIFHTSQKKSSEGVYSNDTINARNEAISQIADGQHVFFINCNAVFDDESGALTSTYTGDGVHVKAPYYKLWRDYLLQFGRTGASVAAEAAVSEPEAPSQTAAPAAETTVPVKPDEPAVEIPASPEETPASGEASGITEETAPVEETEAAAPTETGEASTAAPAPANQPVQKPAATVQPASEPAAPAEVVETAAPVEEPPVPVEATEAADEPVAPVEAPAPATESVEPAAEEPAVEAPAPDIELSETPAAGSADSNVGQPVMLPVESELTIFG